MGKCQVVMADQGWEIDLLLLYTNRKSHMRTPTEFLHVTLDDLDSDLSCLDR